MIGKLIWKEWCEQRWKLALACVVMMAFVLIGLQARIVMDKAIVACSVMLGGLVLPVFVGMDLVAAERAEGSLQTLLALPIRPWKTLAVKLAMGMFSCVVPILGAGLIAYLIAGGRELTTSRMVAIYASTASLAVSVLICMLAFGIREPNEARAATVGVAVVVAWTLISTIYVHTFTRAWPYAYGLQTDWIISLLPANLSLVIGPQSPGALAIVLPIQVLAATALFVWAAMRFAKGGRID